MQGCKSTRAAEDGEVLVQGSGKGRPGHPMDIGVPGASSADYALLSTIACPCPFSPQHALLCLMRHVTTAADALQVGILLEAACFGAAALALLAVLPQLADYHHYQRLKQASLPQAHSSEQLSSTTRSPVPRLAWG